MDAVLKRNPATGGKRLDCLKMLGAVRTHTSLEAGAQDELLCNGTDAEVGHSGARYVLSCEKLEFFSRRELPATREGLVLGTRSDPWLTCGLALPRFELLELFSKNPLPATEGNCSVFE